jgi:hypothetical protein
MQRWLKCGYTREFDLNIVVPLWDAALALDHIITYEKKEQAFKKNINHSLIMFDYLAVVLLHEARKEILNKDNNEIYQKFLSVNNSKSSEYLINASLKLHKFLFDKKNENNFKEVRNKSDKCCPYVSSQLQFISLKKEENKLQNLLSYDDVRKLENIYSKYKNIITLKDSKDFRMAINKIKKYQNENK